MLRMRPLILGLFLAALLCGTAAAKPLGPPGVIARQTGSKMGVTPARHDAKTAQRAKKTLPPKRVKMHASKHGKTIFKPASAANPFLLVLDDLGIC